VERDLEGRRWEGIMEVGGIKLGVRRPRAHEHKPAASSKRCRRNDIKSFCHAKPTLQQVPEV